MAATKSSWNRPSVAVSIFTISFAVSSSSARMALDRRACTAPVPAALPTDRIDEFEKTIDRCDAELPPLEAFIMPGGTAKAAALHLARTVCRRAERSVVTLHATAEVPAEILTYLNRLSDLLFVLARLANHRAGAGDVSW